MSPNKKFVSPIDIKGYLKGRVAIFVDAANILYSQQTLGWDIDYHKILKYFKRLAKLVNAYFYSGVVSNNPKQVKFFDMMKDFGYIVRTKEVKWIRDYNGRILKGKGNLDIELALDASQNINNYDTAIFFTGDSDFVQVVQFIKNHNKQVIVFSTRGHIAKELAREASKYIPFEDVRIFFERKKSPRI